MNGSDITGALGRMTSQHDGCSTPGFHSYYIDCTFLLFVEKMPTNNSGKFRNL